MIKTNIWKSNFMIWALNDLRHNLKRGKEFGYEHLVRKHSAALEIMNG